MIKPKAINCTTTAGRFCFAHLQGKEVKPMGRRKKPETLDELQTEVERAEKELHYLVNRQKIQEKQAKELTRKARTRRLCTRAGMLESFLERPEDLTDDQVMELLAIAFLCIQGKILFPCATTWLSLCGLSSRIKSPRLF